MYRKSSDILTALQTGKTSIKSCRNQLSIARKNNKPETALMFLIAIELYRFYDSLEDVPKLYRDL